MSLGSGTAGWLQAAVIMATLVLFHIPLGDYIARVLGPSAADGVRHSRAERLIYRLCGVNPQVEQNWRQYLRSVFALSAGGILVLYVILRLQARLPYSQGLGGLSPALAWNTAVSFVTNTSWQNYSGEGTTGYTAVAAGLGIEAFASAAVGLAVSLALVRGLVRRQTEDLGNFWVDFTRSTMRVLLPLALIGAVLLAGLGVIQNWDAAHGAAAVAGGSQTIPGGPVASWEPIKLMSGDGGGFFNANSAHPFENPNGWTNAFEIILMLLVPVAMIRAYGRMIGSKRQGWALFSVAAVLFLLMAAGTALSESHALGTAAAAAHGTAEGKETRFGAGGSALFGISATGSADGAANSSYDSFTAFGGGILMSAMMLGEIAPGGVGSGLYGLLMIALIAVFLGGLMVGRTPEFVRKRIGGREMTHVALYYLATPFVLLAGAALAVALPGERASMGNSGPHGLSEVLYAFTSSANSNGSAFGGFNGNTTWYNVALGLVMLLGRYLPMVFVLALAGALARQKPGAVTAGTLRTDGPMFVTLTGASAVVLVGLTFLPALALGPLAEGLH
jgi:K+-transporting ATPase ATPase A chain